MSHVDLKRIQDAAISSQDFGNLFRENCQTPGLSRLRRSLLDEGAAAEIRQAGERATEDGINVNISRGSMVALLTEEDGAPVIHPWKARYLDQLIVNPEIHPSLKAVLGSAIEGRRARIQDVSDALDGVEGYQAAIGKECATFSPPRPVTFGVSALLVASDDTGETFGLISQRSDSVALNPGVFTASVEGGLGPSTDPLDQLEGEARDELRDALRSKDLVDWTFLQPAGMLIPGEDPLKLSAGAKVARVGVSALYVISVGDKSRLDAICAETCEAIRRESEGELAIGFKEGEPKVVNLADLLADGDAVISESLAATAVLSIAQTRAEESSAVGFDFGLEIRNIEGGELKVVANEYSSQSASSLTANQRFADALLLRFPHLQRACERLEDFSESSFATRGNAEKKFNFYSAASHALRVLIEFELVDDDALGHTDKGRLYEAVVYQIHRHMFSGRATQAQELVRKLHSESEARAKMGFDFATECAEYAHEVGLPAGRLSENHPAWRRHDFLRRSAKRRLTSAERESLRSAIHRLAFSCAVVQMEIDQDPGAAQYVFSGENREPFAGDPLALYYKAKGVAVSPVLPMSQLVVGFQFAQMASSHYPRHAGMHHVVARYELRIGDGEVSEESKNARQLSALERVNRAIELDPEVADFYVTRARIRRLRGDRIDARVDIESAIELERFVAGGADAGDARIKGLLDLLDDYTL